MGIYNLAWGIVLLPLLGVLVSLLAETQRRAVQACVVSSAGALLLAAITLGVRLTHQYQAPFDNTITFFAMSPQEGTVFATRFEPFFGVHVDALSTALGFAVAFAVLVVQAYALGSLRGDTGYRRFAWTSSLVSFATLGFIFSPNLFQSMFMWLGGSVAIYLMATHWWQREDAAAPARRIAVALHISDISLLLGAVFAFVKLGVYASTVPAQAGQDITDPFSFTTISNGVAAVLHGQVAGAGPRSINVLAAVLIFAMVVRAAQFPFHVWLSELTTAPVPVVAIGAGVGGVVPAYLLARVYPVVISAPHALTALGLTAGVTGVVVALVCVAQRDVLRIAALSAVLPLALAFIAMSGGGYGQGMFILFTGLLFSTLAVLAGGNLVRVFRTRNLHELGGAARRMRTTTLALSVWAAGIGGLALQTYYALSSVFADRTAAGVPMGALSRDVVVALTLAAAAAGAFAVFRVLAHACFGAPARRRGFHADRVAEVERPLRRWTLLLTAGAVAAVLGGLPGIAAVHSGRTNIPGLSFTNFVFFGTRPAASAVDAVALLLCLGVLLLAAAAALVLFGASRRAATAAAADRARPLVRVLSHDLYLDRAARRIGEPFLMAGRFVERFDERVLESITDTAAQGMALGSWGLGRLRTTRVQWHLAGGLALILTLLILSLLAATGNLPVHTA